jgi:hypothetical protein
MLYRERLEIVVAWGGARISRGGGTAQVERQQRWRTRLSLRHPSPCRAATLRLGCHPGRRSQTASGGGGTNGEVVAAGTGAAACTVRFRSSVGVDSRPRRWLQVTHTVGIEL